MNMTVLGQTLKIGSKTVATTDITDRVNITVGTVKPASGWWFKEI